LIDKSTAGFQNEEAWLRVLRREEKVNLYAWLHLLLQASLIAWLLLEVWIVPRDGRSGDPA